MADLLLRYSQIEEPLPPHLRPLLVEAARVLRDAVESNDNLHAVIANVLYAFDTAPLADTWWMPKMLNVSVYDYLATHHAKRS